MKQKIALKDKKKLRKQIFFNLIAIYSLLHIYVGVISKWDECRSRYHPPMVLWGLSN
jgi:hypothetical protein